MIGLLVAMAVLAAAVPARPGAPTRRVGPQPGVPALIGAALRRPFSQAVSFPADRVIGSSVLAAGLSASIDIRLALPAGFVVWAHDVARRRRRSAERSAAIGRELPEVIDLLGLAMAGGGSIHVALALVSRRPIGPVSRRLAEADAHVRDGARLVDALEAVVRDIGPPVRPLIRALTGAEHYGTSIGQTLERLAAEARHTRRRDAEARARRIPVRLLGPLVLGVLPAFVLLTVVPTVARTLQGLSFTPGP